MSNTPSLPERTNATLDWMDNNGTSSPEVRKGNRTAQALFVGVAALGSAVALSPDFREYLGNTEGRVMHRLDDLNNNPNSTTLPENPSDMVVEVAPPPITPTPAP